MGKLMLLIILSISFRAYSQPNPMFKSEQEVRKLMVDYKGYFNGSDYSNSGERCIKYSFAMSNPEKYLDAVFFINSNGICDGANYYYPNSNELKLIVLAMDAIPAYKKIDGVFAWINKNERFSIEIVRPPSGDGFLFQYNHLNNE